MLRVTLYWGLFIFCAVLLVCFIEMLKGNEKDSLARYTPVLLVTVALTPIFLRDLCVLSNRFVGPMVRLRRSMRALADGEEVAHLKFRDNDFWHEIASDFNRLAARVEAGKVSSHSNVSHEETFETEEEETVAC